VTVLTEARPHLSLVQPAPHSHDSAVSAERLRIARELHDVVGHGLATISLQAGVATHVAEQRPQAALEALESIRSTSRFVLDEVRAILGQLRGDDGLDAPARGIGALSALVDATTNAETATSLQIVGRPRPLPLATDQAVYRITQEALANVLRHAHGSAARVCLTYERHRLVVTISNGEGGRPSEHAENSTGYGIRGMHERVRELGGELQASARPDGGFEVRASLPFVHR
jgi:signal transduction histidine kinase